MYTGNHPFKKYSEQLNILINDKKLIVDDPQFAINSLQHYSYYNLINGYKDLFLDNSFNYDRFIDGTIFEMLYQVQWIDMEMSSLLFRYSLLVEKKIKTRLSYLMASQFGELESEYLKSSNFSTSRNNRGKLNTVIKSIDKNRRIDISAIHYMDQENNLPPWIATKAISFGDAFTWYSLLKIEDKLNIIDNFCLPIENLTNNERMMIFNKLVGQVYKYRNLSAHGNRSFKLKIDNEYELPFNTLVKMKVSDYFENQSRKSLYSVIFCMFIMIDDPYAIENFYRDISYLFSKYSKEEYKFIDKDIYDLFDFPKDFLRILRELIASKKYRDTFYN